MSARYPGPGSRPPLDELASLRDGPHALLLRAGRQYGPIFRYPVGPLPVYVVTGPEGVKHILQDNHKNYSKATFQYRLLSSITGSGLLTADGDLWFRQRRLAQPVFHRQRLQQFAAPMAEAVERMTARWQQHAASGQPLDAAAEMMHVALQIIGRTMLSIEIGDQADALAQATLTVLDHIVGRARTFGLLPQWLPTTGNRRARAALAVLDQAIADAVRTRQARPDEGQADFLGLLMNAADPETGERMPDRQLRDELMTILVAGHETVASALAWTWHLLAANPDAEAKLHAELDRVLDGRPPTPADLPQLGYTEMVFQEALRLYPPAWIITRRALADDEIGGWRIPAGALVVASPYVTHRLAEHWDEPDAFRPERFAAEAAAGRPRYAYYPFGGGPRLCIGNTFALLEAQIVIAAVAGRFVLRPAGAAAVEVEPGVTLRPKHGLMMRVEERES